MAIKVVILVSGGNVQWCAATREDVEIELIDFDNIAEEGADAMEAAEERAEEVSETMHLVY